MMANDIPNMFVMLREQVIDPGRIDLNPSKVARALKVPDDRNEAHLPWPDQAVRKFRSDTSELPRLIFDSGIGLVQRPGGSGQPGDGALTD